MEKIYSLFFDNVATKVKKCTRFFVLLNSGIIALATVIFMFYCLANFSGIGILLFILAPVACAILVFGVWLTNSVIYMFCELVENSKNNGNKSDDISNANKTVPKELRF